eukprot:2831803-Pyramimonas_sp.AAC.1
MHQKTIMALQEHPKPVHRQTQDTIINLKKKYEQTSKNKHAETINGGSGKRIPQYVKKLQEHRAPVC